VSDPSNASRPTAVGLRAAPTGRSMTSAEARVIASLLAADAIPERDRIRASGLSPRTYETARRRVFDAGWVYERFVPDPLAWGLTSLRFDLVQPERGQEGSVSERLAASPGTFHIWQGDGLVLAASLLDAEKTEARTKARERVTDPDRSWQLVADLRQPTVPIYFDFEGAWSRVVGAAGPRIYPRPLPHWTGGESSSGERPSDHVRREAEALIRRPFHGAPRSSSGRHLGSILGFGGPRGPLSTGLVQRRCFLDLTKLPAVDGWQLRSLSFVTGTLRTSLSPATLHHALLYEGGMTPFLSAEGQSKVLIGALSPAPRSTLARTRTRISEILTKELESWTMVGTPVSSLSTPVDHRYDRLLVP
jgi:hypothetical protein